MLVVSRNVYIFADAFLVVLCLTQESRESHQLKANNIMVYAIGVCMYTFACNLHTTQPMHVYLEMKFRGQEFVHNDMVFLVVMLLFLQFENAAFGNSAYQPLLLTL